MLSIDLFDSKYERELREGAVDDLEYRRMNDLREKMEYLMQAYRQADTDEVRNAIMARYNEYKTERESYTKVREQQVPSKQDPFAYVKPEPQGIGDVQDPKQKMAQLAQRSKKGPLANVAAGIKAFVKGEPEPMGEQAQPRTHAQNVYFEILKAWEDERDYIVLPFPNAPNPVTMIRGQIWNAIVDLGLIKDPKRRAKYVEDRFNDFESFMSWLGNLKRYKVPPKKKGKTQSLPLQIPQQPTGQSQPTAPGSPMMDPEFTGIKPPGNLQEKKKSNDLEPKDVGLSRELQKARARFPAAASDLEAGILDQMDQQQQAQQALTQQQADLNRQDQQITSLTQTNQQQDGILRTQGQEIDRLTQRLQQVVTRPTAATAPAPVAPQAEPSAPAVAPAPDVVYVPDVPADTATQDKEIARLDKQIQQLELMMALKTPAERSDLEARISDLETARAEQEEKKRATAKKSAATRKQNQQTKQTKATLKKSAGDTDTQREKERTVKNPDEFVANLLRDLPGFQTGDQAGTNLVTNEGQPQELINRYLAINAETDVEAVRKAIQAISKDPALGANSKARLLGQIGMIIKRHRLPIGRSYYQFMQQYMEAVELDRNRVPGYPNDPATVKHRLDTAKSILSDPRSDADSRREAAAIVAKSQSMAEGKIKDIDIMRQDLDSMSDLQFFRAHGMKKDQFKYKYRTLLKPAPQQDVPVQESLRPGEYHIHTVYFKDGSKKRIRVTSDEVDVADYYTKRGQAVDRVDYDYQIHSDIAEQDQQPGTAIPRKSIIQGYTVYWNPTTQMVSVTRGGDSEQAAIEQARVKNINKDRFLAAAYRMIDRIEELAENINREPKTARERDDMIDKIQRMMTQDRNPANLQIMKKDIEILKAKYRDLKEDSDSTEAVEMAIMRRMLVAHTDLIVKHGLDGVVAAIEEVAEDVGEVDEIGNSDVSAYVRQVQRILEPDNEV